MNILRSTLMIASLLCSWPSIAAETTGSMQVDGVQRTWLLFLPDKFDRNQRYPLVLDFHGTGGNPRAQSTNSELATLAQRAGFLVVNPAGVYRRTPDGGNTWNVDLDPKGVDDVRFVRELIKHLGDHYPIDPQRIYSTGFSGGARMSSRLACDLSDVIAAIAAVGGIRFPDACTPARPVAILAIHTEDDEVNHFLHRSDSPAYWPEGVPEAIARWAQQNKCAAEPAERKLQTGAVQLTYERCRSGGDVVLTKLQQGGHTWPGSPAEKRRQTSRDGGAFDSYPATEQIWTFFRLHTRR